MFRVIYIPEVPETLHSQRERGWLTARGRRSNDNSNHTLLIINEANGSWTIHGLGAPGVRLTRDAMMVLATQVLERAR
jgi:hypothetical protein